MWLNYATLCLLFLFAGLQLQAQSTMSQDPEFQKLLKQAAKGKSSAVQSVISWCKTDELRAYCEHALAEASDNGSFEATVYMAEHTFSRSPDSAIMYYKRGVEANKKGYSQRFANDIARIYYSGEPSFYAGKSHPEMINLPKAKEWFEKAIAMGYTDNGGMFDPKVLLARTNNALAHHYNNGGEAYAAGDMMEAYRLWSLEADHWIFRKDKATSITPAQLDALNGLGLLYRNGQGVGKDLYQSAVWYERAGDAGETEAYIRSGNVFCLTGSDYLRAVEVYKKAADRGNEEGRKLAIAAQATQDRIVRNQQASDQAGLERLAEERRKRDAAAQQGSRNSADMSKPNTTYTPYYKPDGRSTEDKLRERDRAHDNDPERYNR